MKDAIITAIATVACGVVLFWALGGCDSATTEKIDPDSSGNMTGPGNHGSVLI